MSSTLGYRNSLLPIPDFFEVNTHLSMVLEPLAEIDPWYERTCNVLGYSANGDSDLVVAVAH